MTPKEFTELLTVIVALIQAIVWPLIALFVFLNLRVPVQKFLEKVTKISGKAAGVELTFEQLEAAAILGAASTKNDSAKTSALTPDQGRAREIAKVVSQAGKPQAIKRLSDATVLWVDDSPSNNVYERGAMEKLGMHFTLATSTEEALETIKSRSYDLIISDMGRGSDKQAGYRLLDEISRQGYSIPFIIYSGSSSPQSKAEARSKGAFGQTNNPQELVTLVLKALQGESADNV